MSARDIMPVQSSMGGHTRVISHGLTGTVTFLEGEPVKIAAAGTVTEADDDPTGGQVVGIALEPRSATQVNWRTGVAYAANDVVSIVVGDDQTLFEAQNFATDGAGTAATPTLAHIGDESGLTLATGVWSVDIGATNNVVKIIDVLDADGVSISESGGTGVTVIFKFSDSQWQNVTAPA